MAWPLRTPPLLHARLCDTSMPACRRCRAPPALLRSAIGPTFRWTRRCPTAAPLEMRHPLPTPQSEIAPLIPLADLDDANAEEKDKSWMPPRKTKMALAPINTSIIGGARIGPFTASAAPWSALLSSPIAKLTLPARPDGATLRRELKILAARAGLSPIKNGRPSGVGTENGSKRRHGRRHPHRPPDDRLTRTSDMCIRLRFSSCTSSRHIHACWAIHGCIFCSMP